MSKPLLSHGEMLDKGWDAHLHSKGPYYAVKEDGTSIKFRREGNRFRLDAEVVLPEDDGNKCQVCFTGQDKSP